MPAADFLRLGEAIRPIVFRDAMPLISGLRMIKSPREVERVATIAGIASDGFAALPSLVSGLTSLRQVCQALALELVRRGADKTPYLVGESGAGGYESLIMGPDDRALDRGDIVFIDTGSTFDGYFCDFDRNFAVGAPAKVIQSAHATMYRATEAGLAALCPGRTTGDVWRAMAKVIEEAGGRAAHVGRMGHGLGLSLTEPPSIHPEDRTILVPGMVLTLEPSMTYEWPTASGSVTKLMVHEENVVITEDGSRLLTRRAPEEMPLLDIGDGPLN
jgi:Xaa-Pro aminopeptidase